MGIGQRTGKKIEVNLFPWGVLQMKVGTETPFGEHGASLQSLFWQMERYKEELGRD